MSARSWRTTYVVREHEQIAIPADLILRNGSLDVFPSVVQHGYFTVRPRRGPLVLQAGGFVGVIPLNDRVTIDVRTRVPVRNLSRMLRVSGQIPVSLEHAIREYEREPDLYPSLVDVYARTLSDYVLSIGMQGLLREYTRRDEVTSFPRGRILLSETIKSLEPKGLTYKVATSRFQRTPDIPANQCLKYAIWLLSRLRSSLVVSDQVPRTRRVPRALNQAFAVFDAVSMDHGRRFLRDPIVTGRQRLPSVRAYYRPALDLAQAVISQSAIMLDREGGNLVMPSLILSMWEVFEAYVRNALIAESHSAGWRGEVLDGNRRMPQGGARHLFDSGKRTFATPDVVLQSGTPAARPVVVDVKYKPAQKLDRDDLNQIIAYGTSYGCRDVVLVQPKAITASPPAGMRTIGTLRGLTVHQYVFDLNASNIADEEGRFAAAMWKLCAATA